MSATQTTTLQTALFPNLYAVILAGGEGTRFAPYSTPEKPKQFLHITDTERTMIQMTFDRITQLVPPQNVIISTNRRYEKLVAEQLPDVPAKNVVAEPMKKNTAAPIALINYLIHMRDRDAVMLFLPSDHFIANIVAALETYKFAAAVAACYWDAGLLTFGIVPTFASPDYGYVRRSGVRKCAPAYKAQEFVEKPTREVAQKYLETGEYLWNGGMFCWEASVFDELVQVCMPELHTALQTMELTTRGALNKHWMNRFFASLNKNDGTQTSVDYGVMEPASLRGEVSTLPFNAGWSDVGGWVALAQLVEREGITLHPDAQAAMERWLARHA